MHFCGRPASYIRMHEHTQPVVPLPKDCNSGVARDPNSFRPSLMSLKKTHVYPAMFVYERGRLKYIQIRQGNKYNTHFYSPIS